MFKKFLNKYCSGKVLIRLLIFCVVSISISYFCNKLKLQDVIVNLLCGMSIYYAFLCHNNRLTNKEQTLAFTISLVSVLTLFVFVILIGTRHTI
jgi:hypothetical protein